MTRIVYLNIDEVQHALTGLAAINNTKLDKTKKVLRYRHNFFISGSSIAETVELVFVRHKENIWYLDTKKSGVRINLSENVSLIK